MPLIADEFVPLRTRFSTNDVPKPEDPALWDIVGAAGTVQNAVYRGWRFLSNRAEVAPEEDFDPFEMIKGTKYESDPERFAFAMSRSSAEALMREWDEDEHARGILARSGWSGTVAQIGMGMLDPTVFMPMAKVFSGAVRGASALRIGADAAISGAIGSAISESVMYATTPEYTAADVAQGVGTATILSGLLGAGAGALASRAERAALTDLLHADRMAWGEEIASGARSVGAAAADTRELSMRMTSDPTALASPPRRTIGSGFLTARRMTVDLVETPYVFGENSKGIATTQGPAVSRHADLEINKSRVRVAEAMDSAYARYRSGAEQSTLQKALRGVRDMAGAPADGKMRFREFEVEIDRALRNSDTHDIPEVAEVARVMREEMSSWRDRAIAQKMLPEGVDAKTADSYMMRRWDKHKLTARRPEARRVIGDWLEARQIDDAAKDDAFVPRSRQEIDRLADEIINRIISSPESRLDYDGGEGSSAVSRTGGRGPLAARAFLIPDALVMDFIRTDVTNTFQSYLRTMVPDVLLTERFGDVEMTDAFKKLDDEFSDRSNAAKTPAERARIEKEYKAVTEDLAAMRDRIRGIYGFSTSTRGQFYGRMAQTAKKVDMITNLGGAVMASLFDIATLHWRYGMMSMFKNAWVPMIKAIGSEETRRAVAGSKRQLKALGIAAETYLSSRSNSFYDVTDVYAAGSKFERTADAVSEKFGIVNLMAPFTDFTRLAGGMTSSAEITAAVEAVAAGRAKPRQIRDLAEGGIDAVMAGRIWKEMIADGGSDVIDGIRISNSGAWKDAGARNAFDGMLARDVDLLVITPGAEKPLMMSRPVWGLVLQYKSFVAAANERLLIRNLQARDHRALLAMASTMAMGALVEAVRAYAVGREPPKETSDWVKAAIINSGLLGWYQEANSISSKWTGGAADIYRLVGADMPDARYISRSPGAALLGPVYGKFETTVSAFSKLTAKMLGGGQDWTANDTYQLRRLLPAQNLFYIRQLLDSVEDEFNEAIGVAPKERGR